MRRLGRYFCILLAAGVLFPGALAFGSDGNRALLVTVGKTLIVDSEVDMDRVAVGNSTLAGVIPINSREVLVNGLRSGKTSIVVWEAGEARFVYDLTVRESSRAVDAVRRQLAAEIGSGAVTLVYENGAAFLRGTVRDATTAERAAVIAGTLGKIVNLLYVAAPPAESQSLLKAGSPVSTAPPRPNRVATLSAPDTHGLRAGPQPDTSASRSICFYFGSTSTCPSR